MQPSGTNQHLHYNTNNTNNKNNNNNCNNNNLNIENQASQNLRLHGVQQAQQHVNFQQKYHNCMNLSNSSAILNTQIICTKQNLRNVQLHQKPISSVAPSFPVKSPIYQTSSTKIHPVMPQTLSLLSRGHTGTQNYNTLNIQNPSKQSTDNVQNNSTQEVNCVIKSNTPSVSAATISVTEQSYEKPSSKLEGQVRFEQNGVNDENNATQNKNESQVNLPLQHIKVFDNTGKQDLINVKQDFQLKREQSVKSETVKPDLNAKFDLKFDQILFLKNDSTGKHDASVELKVKLDSVKYDKNQIKFDNPTLFDPNVELLQANSNTKFESFEKLSEKFSEQDKIKSDVGRKIFLYNEMKSENKNKPTLPPKPTKSNSTPKLIDHEKLEFVNDVDEYAVNTDRYVFQL